MRPPKYLGVYSTTPSSKSDSRKVLFFAWEAEAALYYVVQALDKAFQPKGPPERVDIVSFFKAYKAEPSILAMPVKAPDVSLLAGPKVGVQAEPTEAAPQAAPAEEARTQAQKDEDERLLALEQSRKAKQVEHQLRENFRKTLLRLKRPREREAALKALEQLAATSENISPLHKHMFRDFGVKLRQTSLPDLARLFSERVLALAPEDDHAHFNLARVLCALRLYDEAALHIETAITLDPNECIYTKMLHHIARERELHPGQKRPQRKR